MLVERAPLSCLPAIDTLRIACIRHMQAAGIDQWDDLYPTADVFHRDCREGNLFILQDPAHQLLGSVTLDRHQAPEYSTVQWSHQAEPIAIIHRLMISPEHQGRGHAKILMRGLEAEARRQGVQTLRLDTYQHNPIALHLYSTLGYRRAGQVTFRKGLFTCFEKSL